MKITAIELNLCKQWAREHAGEDDPLDVFHWKILDSTAEATQRTADFLGRQVEDEKADRDSISANFYTEEEPVDDSDVEF